MSEFFSVSQFPSLLFRLTAFVVQSFVESMPFITVDEDVINAAIRFLMLTQMDDGSFYEPGRLLSSTMAVSITGRCVRLPLVYHCTPLPTELQIWCFNGYHRSQQTPMSVMIFCRVNMTQSETPVEPLLDIID